MSFPCTSTSLTPWQRRSLVALTALVVVFGCLVVYRSAVLSRRMGDLGCYLRAAWAVRTGGDLYGVTDDNDWHYNYPPLLAILLTPLADPPRGDTTGEYVPYAVSVAIWYVLGLLSLCMGVHYLAKAIERQRVDPPSDQEWWRLRVLPVMVCLPMVGHSLMRGQANLLALACICGMAAGLMTGRRFTAGLCLAGAACIKVFPAFLVLYPIFRRDVRCLAGVAVGGLIGMGLIPGLCFGPEKTLAHYRTYASVLLGPALGQGGDSSRKEEILGVNSTDSQSFKEIIHNTMHPARGRTKQVASWVFPAHLAIGACLTLITLVAASRRSATHEPMMLGCLMIVAVLVSPICHLHYFCYAMPLVVGLVSRSSRLGVGMFVIFSLFLLCNILPHLPGMWFFRDLGLAMYGTLLVWMVGVVAQWRSASLRAAKDDDIIESHGHRVSGHYRHDQAQGAGGHPHAPAAAVQSHP